MRRCILGNPIVKFIRGFFEVAGVVKTVSAAASGVVSAIVFSVWGRLSDGVVILLSVLVFIAVLTLLQPAIRRRMLLSERVAELEGQLAESEWRVRSLEQGNRRLRERLISRDADRLAFREVVLEALREGERLWEWQPDREQVDEWEGRVRRLLKAGSGTWIADRVLVDGDHKRLGTFEQKRLESRTNNMWDYARVLEEHEDVAVRRGFDEDDYGWEPEY